MLKKGDIYLIAVLLLAIVTGFAFVHLYGSMSGNTHRISVIRQGDRLIKRIDLDAQQGPVKVEIDGEYRETVLVENGRIRFESADCPDKICVRTGWISKKGDTAVCLPNRTIIKIEGDNPEVDGVTY